MPWFNENIFSILLRPFGQYLSGFGQYLSGFGQYLSRARPVIRSGSSIDKKVFFYLRFKDIVTIKLLNYVCNHLLIPLLGISRFLQDLILVIFDLTVFTVFLSPTFVSHFHSILVHLLSYSLLHPSFTLHSSLLLLCYVIFSTCASTHPPSLYFSPFFLSFCSPFVYLHSPPFFISSFVELRIRNECRKDIYYRI